MTLEMWEEGKQGPFELWRRRPTGYRTLVIGSPQGVDAYTRHQFFLRVILMLTP